VGGFKRLLDGAWPSVSEHPGQPHRPDNFHHGHWKPLLTRDGLSDMRFHDLRHTCATLLLTQGVHPKVLSEKLGQCKGFQHARCPQTRDARTGRGRG
jgi:integrase